MKNNVENIKTNGLCWHIQIEKKKKITGKIKA